jgi:hypothetical protein
MDNQNNPPVDSQTNVTTTGCHSGTFMCSNGPDWSPCGTWQFDVTEAESLVGTGTITLPGSSAPVNLTLAGAADPTADAQEITLTGDGEGGGTMHVSNVGPTLEVTGDWSFSTGPDVNGDEIVGEITGTSCRSLQ